MGEEGEKPLEQKESGDKPEKQACEKRRKEEEEVYEILSQTKALLLKRKRKGKYYI